MLALDEISPIEIQAFYDNTPELWNKAVLALEERHRDNPDETETILRLGHINSLNNTSVCQRRW